MRSKSLDTINILIFGYSKVGKMSIIQSFLGIESIEEDLTRDFQPFHGQLNLKDKKEIKFILFVQRVIDLSKDELNKIIDLCHGVILILELTNAESFDYIKNVVEKLKESPKYEKLYITIFANNCEPELNYEIQLIKTREFINENKFIYHSISTIDENKKGIKELMKYTIEEVYNNKYSKKKNIYFENKKRKEVKIEENENEEKEENYWCYFC